MFFSHPCEETKIMIESGKGNTFFDEGVGFVIIHTEKFSDKILISAEEWALIIQKLKQIEDVKIEEKNSKNSHIFSGKGIFKEFANPELMKKEKEAWANSVIKKHENN